ncbi:MAG: ROK family protein [Christensenellales bacterium]
MAAIGVDIGGTSIKMALIENNTEILQKTSFPFDKDPYATAANIVRMVKNMRALSPDAKVGISCAGSIDNGVIWADNLFWNAIDMGKILLETLGERVPIANDAFCALNAEWKYGALKGQENAVYMTVGTGIGGAILSEGRVVRGTGGYGGEIGHMVTHVGGLQCACSNIGCYEMYASARALSRMAGGLPVREIVQKVERGELRDVWRRYLTEVCAGLLSLMAVFAPSTIAIGGGLSNSGNIFIKGILDTLNATEAYPRLYHYVQVRLGAFRNDAGVIGAADLAEGT